MSSEFVPLTAVEDTSSNVNGDIIQCSSGNASMARTLSSTAQNPHIQLIIDQSSLDNLDSRHSGDVHIGGELASATQLSHALHQTITDARSKTLEIMAHHSLPADNAQQSFVNLSEGYLTMASANGTFMARGAYLDEHLRGHLTCTGINPRAENFS